VIALAISVSLPLVGMSAAAMVKVRTSGCHQDTSCKQDRGTRTGDATPTPMILHIRPNPVRETARSSVVAEIYVATGPSFAGDEVNITSSQLQGSCGGEIHFSLGARYYVNNIQVILNDKAKVEVQVHGRDCAPGPSVVEADLMVAPYYSALTTLNAKPPRHTLGDGGAGRPGRAVRHSRLAIATG